MPAHSPVPAGEHADQHLLEGECGGAARAARLAVAGLSGQRPPTGRRLAAAAAALALGLCVGAVELAGGFAAAAAARASPWAAVQKVDGKVIVGDERTGAIQNKATGLCLDWGELIVYGKPCKPGSPEQLWSFSTPGQYIHANDNRCLDSGGEHLHVWNCMGAVEQRFSFSEQAGMISQAKESGALCLQSIGTSAPSLQQCTRGMLEQTWEVVGHSVLRLPNTTARPPTRPPATSPTTSPTKSPTALSTAPPASPPAAPASSRSEVTVPVTKQEPDDHAKDVVSFQLKHSSNRCLSGDSKLSLTDCELSSRRQRWTADLNSGRLWRGGRGCLTAGEADLLLPCHDDPRGQQWSFDVDKSLLMAAPAHEQCLTAAGTQVLTQPCDAMNQEQKWEVAGIRYEGVLATPTQ